MNKQQRYRQKMKDKGCCQRCGKLCEPYSSCKEHRKKQREKRNKGIYKSHTSIKLIPRIMGRPAIYFPELIEDFKELGIEVSVESFLNNDLS